MSDICVYDFIIIGGGFAGLYFCYKLKKLNQNIKFLLLEKNISIGGRALQKKFYGSNVSLGAGVGRKDTNPLLQNLCKELNEPISESKAIIDYAFDNYCDIVEVLNYLKKEYSKNPEKYKCMIFKNFCIEILGIEKYKTFKISNGYTDYEKADVYETLYHYGIEDNKSGWDKLYLNWESLINKLVENINHHNIKLSQEVIDLEKKSNIFKVSTTNSQYYYSKNIVIATTLKPLQKLLNFPLYKQIHSQIFLRVYAKLNKNIVSNYTVVDSPLQKIIPINPKNNIYMIAYTDNENSIIINKILNNCNKIKLLEELLEKSLNLQNIKILDMIHFWWDEGTHYYSPLCSHFKSREEFIKKAQNPQENIFVIGEIVSELQGWVEGALQSVENIIILHHFSYNKHKLNL